MTRAKRLQTSPVVWRDLRNVARELRRESTPAEDLLWQALRSSRPNGLKFRRQHVIDTYVVDFYCVKASLVVEVDGSIHNETVEQDNARQAYLEELGLRVIRFTNEDVLNHLDGVLDRIASEAGRANP